ncbi:MAG TPA: glycoside hydrolase family 95 protein [Chitinophagaceae bacterium]|nr:glycoside hydrolase family 95 protein [Chitinophagaceae bacterium]
MRIYCLLLLLCSTATLFAQENISAAIDAKQFDPSTLIWFNKPAAKWEEALPVGNGRLGAMVFGKPGQERIQLNEDTYWSGGPYSSVVKGAYKALPEVQKDVFEGKYMEAHNLFGRKMMGYPVEQQKYQCLGNLILFFKGEENAANYKRWLNLATATASTRYTANGITFQRDVVASVPGQVIAIRFTADKPGSISFVANLRGVRNQEMSNYTTDYFQMNSDGNNCLVLTGKSGDYMGIKGMLRYEARVKAVAEGGTVTVTDNINLTVKNADAVTLYFVAATNFVNYKNVSADQHKRVMHYLAGIQSKSYEAIKTAAIADYQKLFNRVSFHLSNTDSSYLPTDERMKAIQSSPDPSLAALCYQFGRYAMIASSRPGTQPANLQGIWNQDANPMWDAKYTTNINTEMNYWPVESANLPECVEPLTQMMKDIMDEGGKVAREHYNARGWVLHQNTDIWRVAAPMDGPTWGTFTVGGAWLTNELWEHYMFTMDTAYLRSIYPVIKGSVQFFMDFLVMHPNGKWLITNPSTSPENFPLRPGNGEYYDEVTGIMLPGTTICAGSSIDMQILHDLFGYYAQACSILKTDSAFATKVLQARAKLAPPQIGKSGMLQEWVEDWGQLEDKHRHMSPLYGLYPGNVISPAKTPGLIDACKKLLEERGDASAGWSRAWKICLWARLFDGERSYKIFKGYLKDQCFPQFFAKGGNVMQVDATFGSAAGIAEMVLQSNGNAIDILPAVPAEWADGDIKGLCARGDFEISMQWKSGKVQQVNILSKAGKPCRIKLHDGQKFTVVSKSSPVKAQYMDDGSSLFATQQDTVYSLVMQ